MVVCKIFSANVFKEPNSFDFHNSDDYTVSEK